MADTPNSSPPSSVVAGDGGFLKPALPSPAPSNTTASSISRSAVGLPHPRSHSLRPGCAKEDKVRRYVEERMLFISRRFVKKYGLPEPGDQVVGYKSMGELCKDVEALINILWLSGTPNLQVPYLLNIASEFATWTASFPPSPAASFSVLRKLDHCFASLLIGMDARTKESLPGFENGLRAGMSRTDMVRCKSLVEQTRILVVEVMGREPGDDEEEDDEDDGSTTPVTMGDDSDGGHESSSSHGRAGIWAEDDERLHMDVARVYENTLVQLGESLGEGAASGDV